VKVSDSSQKEYKTGIHVTLPLSLVERMDMFLMNSKEASTRSSLLADILSTFLDNVDNKNDEIKQY